MLNITDLLRAMVLGFVQGATEFIPVSSSGHLVIVPWLFGWPSPSLLFDTVLHWGTLVSILLVFGLDYWIIAKASVLSLFSRSLQDPNARLGWLIVAGSIPVVLIGLTLQDYVEALFDSPAAAGFFLIVTGGLLALSEQLAKRIVNQTPLERIRPSQVLLIGLAQSLALAPGISRSGTTIATGLATGLRRDVAARFSFLLGAPVFFGAGVYQLMQAAAKDSAQLVTDLPLLIVGFVTSAVIGYIAIRFLLSYLRRHTLYIFAIYCASMGLFTILLAYVRA